MNLFFKFNIYQTKLIISPSPLHPDLPFLFSLLITGITVSSSSQSRKLNISLSLHPISNQSLSLLFISPLWWFHLDDHLLSLKRLHKFIPNSLPSIIISLQIILNSVTKIVFKNAKRIMSPSYKKKISNSLTWHWRFLGIWTQTISPNSDPPNSISVPEIKVKMQTICYAFSITHVHALTLAGVLNPFLLAWFL